VLLLAVMMVALALQAQAAPLQQTTDTPTPTATPAYETSLTLDSGNTLVVDRHWDFGELAIFLAVLAHGALYGLRWIYDVARHEGARDVQEVRIVP